MNIYQLTEIQILFFALILLRMLGFVVSAAIFNHPSVNISLRILFALLLTMTLYPALKIPTQVADGFSENIILFAGLEVTIGLALGFLTRFFFFMLSMVGDLVSMTLGLSAAQMYNPMTQSNSGVFEQFYVLIGALFFLVFNGHHYLVEAMVRSFEFHEVASLSFKTGSLLEATAWAGKLIAIALQISAPIIIAAFLANIVMGVLGRAIPQLNVLVTSFPVIIMLGFIGMIICMPLLMFELNHVLEITTENVMKAVKGL